METAQISCIGDRSSNQDRAEIMVIENMSLLTLADGMGGHLNGGEAAQAALACAVEEFKRRNGNISNATSFLREALTSAHQAVVALGAGIDLESRPRTTITLCLIMGRRACWAHVGDSRIYLLRAARVHARTRDHSAVEMLYQEGIIECSEMSTHPWRNYVEECLGGEPECPAIEIGDEVELKSGDIVVLCSDGFWAPLKTNEWVPALTTAEDLSHGLQELAEQAVDLSRPASDNVTAVASRVSS